MEELEGGDGDEIIGGAQELKSIFHKHHREGYMAGLDEGKAVRAQEGFTKGFREGYQKGFDPGRAYGLISALCAVAQSNPSAFGGEAEVSDLIQLYDAVCEGVSSKNAVVTSVLFNCSHQMKPAATNTPGDTVAPLLTPQGNLLISKCQAYLDKNGGEKIVLKDLIRTDLPGQHDAKGSEAASSGSGANPSGGTKNKPPSAIEFEEDFM